MADLVGKRVKEFFGKYSSTSFQKGEMILQADDEFGYVYYLVRGYIRFYAMSTEGQELTMNIFKPGAYFPMTWVIGGRQNNYYYEAMTGVEVKKVSKSDVMEFVKSDSEVMLELTERMVKGLDGLVGRMEDLFFGGATCRVASSLVMAAERFGKQKKGEVVIDLSLSHQDVAGLAGLTRETTSLEMKKLERRGLICYKRRYVVVLDMAGLTKEAGKE